MLDHVKVSFCIFTRIIWLSVLLEPSLIFTLSFMSAWVVISLLDQMSLTALSVIYISTVNLPYRGIVSMSY